MITQWDIISNIDPQDNSLLYALLIDGTEHDARLIAKKLQGYVQAPQPALAPYVYRFPLPNDLDEDTLEKIRTAVREGVEQAKKVNEFVPGGSFTNTLFNENVMKEDKAFPTFLTLDPSASFFKAPDANEVDVPLPEPEPNNFRQRQINLDTMKEEPNIKTNSSVTVSTLTVKTSAENQPDLPKHSASEPNTLSIKEVFAEKEQQPTAQQPVLNDPNLPHETEPEPLPITEQDMLNKDLEGTLLDQSLEDIFSAETKYDMFLDLEKLAPAQNPLPPKAPSEEQHRLDALGLQQNTLETPENEEGESFNIFDQKIKEQTCFMDLEDVKQITERITQKDLAFAEHANLASDKPAPPAPEEKKEMPPAPKPKPSLSVPLPFSRFERQDTVREEVLDPFEQLLASSSNAETEKQAPSSKQDVPAEPVVQAKTPPTPLPPAQNPQEKSTVPPSEEASLSEAEEPLPKPEISGQTERENRVVPPPAAPIMEKKTMSENTGDKKTILRIKRKETEPIAPAAPVPPAPLPPIPEKSAPTPPAPAPLPNPQAVPTPVIAEVVPPVSEQPQEEKHHTILRRRRPSAHTILEKTRTIDHSIELPLSELKKHNWPLEVPLIPTYTLENMTISVNRFAHATAISIIDNPGKLYNPLVLHGASGTGKTHFLHAIGYALSEKFGQENIFITNGVRLSRGIQRYVMEGNIEKFEEFLNNAKAILIDDIHLIAVNEQNRVHLSKLLNDFISQRKQIVVTSKYPPESLAKLEELLNFKLDSGWISELKDATGKTRTQIVQKMLIANNINISDEDANRFFDKQNMSLGTVNRAIRRVRVLERIIFPHLPLHQRSSKDIFDKLLPTNGEDRSSLITAKDIKEVDNVSVEGKGEWGRIGFFYPQNNSNMMNWLVFALQQRAKELGIPGGPELAVRSSYSTDNIISSAFKIANLCDNKKLKGAVVLGPELDVCDSSVRENFYDILTHMLEIMLIRCGVINYENVNAPSTYVKILSELLR